MNTLKNYASSLIILVGIIIGGIVGFIMGDQAAIFKPFGQLFLNMIFVTIVPLVFFSISSAITKTNQTARLKKILSSSVLVFVATSAVVAVLSYFGFIMFNPLEGLKLADLTQNLTPIGEIQKLTFSEMLVNTLSAGDFIDLFRRTNLLALIIFSILFGIAILLCGEKGRPIANVLESGTEVVIKLVKIIMYAAPVGLGCYFANVVGELGTQIVGAYANVLLLYILLTVIAFFGLNTVYAFLAAGSEGVKVYWRNAMTPSLTAIATTSSAACIPVNLIAVKNMNVPHDVAETVIPLGANIHKDGSVIGGVFKTMFLLGLLAIDTSGINMFLAICAVGLLVGIVIGAIPSGGMTAEVLICTLFGVPVEYVGIILVISIIIDIPATLLNATGNNACTMLITRLTEGRNWLTKHQNQAQQNAIEPTEVPVKAVA